MTHFTTRVIAILLVMILVVLAVPMLAFGSDDRADEAAPIAAQILANAVIRKQAILNSEADITDTGTAYYVANHGNDKNSGKSPEKPWATLSRVNKAKARGTLKPGDAVFLNRGGLWRGYIDCAQGVAYSAYGTGEKPKIYGSSENGADPKNWKLWHDKNGVKIWKFYRSITEVGNIVFDDGASYATRIYAYYNGEKWVASSNDQNTFDIVKELKHDLTFYSTFELSKRQFNRYLVEGWGGTWTNLMDTAGQLYLRCDTGNPGDLYAEIEFHTTPKGLMGYVGLVDPVGDNIIDNLCIKYSLCNGIAIYGDKYDSTVNTNNIIQNCEIAWCGGTQHELNRADGDVMVCGEDVVFKTSGNTFRNNYIHQAACAGIVSEFVDDEWIAGSTICAYTLIVGNLMERCGGTLWFWSNNYPGDDIAFWDGVRIVDNYVMYMGDGWSHDPRFTYPANRLNTYHSAEEPSSFTFNINTSRNGVRNMRISDNVFYISYNGWLVGVAGDVSTFDIVFSGNTYVQTQGDSFVGEGWGREMGQVVWDINNTLGDKTAIIDQLP